MFSGRVFPLLTSFSCHKLLIRYSSLSSQQVTAALRPFYFVVHPDLFEKFPHERNVNENSLKHLNSYLESLLHKTTPGPTIVTFYLRDTGEKPKTQSLVSGSMPSIKVKLHSQDLHATVYSILSACQLPTDYIDTLSSGKPKQKPRSNPNRVDENIFWDRRVKGTPLSDIEDRFKSVDDIDLSKWLKTNIGKAQILVEACNPVRLEAQRLSNSLINVFQLNDIIWDCGWGISHYRGCLQSFYNLAQQFPIEVSILKGRTLVFGRKTGVSLDGHIILSIDHVRHHWLELLESVPMYDGYLAQLPHSENDLSSVLLGMRIDHRKFQPTIMVEKYIHHVSKLTSALYKYRWQKGYPNTWPRRMDCFQLVVECEAGPLMLSPTGQFIVPASCPAFLLVEFITQNKELATERMEQYNQEKHREHDICEETKHALKLSTLQKDDNVTPELMIKCCNRLVHPNCRLLWSEVLKGAHLRVSNFYSVLQDGEICIPWNWKSDLSI